MTSKNLSQNKNKDSVNKQTAHNNEQNNIANHDQQAETVNHDSTITAGVEPESTLKSQSNVLPNELNQTSDHRAQTNETTKKPQPVKEPIQSIKVNAPASKLAIVSILLTAALGGFIYYSQQQNRNQLNTIQALQLDLASLKQNVGTLPNNNNNVIETKVQNQAQRIDSIEQLQKQFNDKLSQQISNDSKLSQTVNNINSTLNTQEKTVQSLHEKIAALSTSSTDNQTWLLSQADYLVKLAGRKIWQDNDFITARLLLQSADSSLAEANDPSLLPIRQAINHDINTLSAVSQIDFDGIILNIIQLADRVSNLAVTKIQNDLNLSLDLPNDTGSKEISTSPTDWKQNLVNNWNGFVEKFISVKRKDNISFSQCVSESKNYAEKQACQSLQALLTPERQMYVRENIRLQLLVAAQAVPRHQNEIYQKALTNIVDWVKSYFNINDVETKAFLADLVKLQQQSISSSVNVPKQLSSTPLLDKVMQTRVRSQLTQPVSALGE